MGQTDRQTDGRTDGRQTVSLRLPFRRGQRINRGHCRTKRIIICDWNVLCRLSFLWHICDL